MIRNFFLILFAITSGIGASQLPNLVLAYQQRLGGAFDETERLMDAFTTQAEDEGLTYQQLADHHAQSSDSAVRGTADRMMALSERHDALNAERQAFAKTKSEFTKLGLMIMGDHDLLRATIATYQPTLTIDPWFGAIGAFLGWLLHSICHRLAFRPRKRHSGSNFV